MGKGSTGTDPDRHQLRELRRGIDSLQALAHEQVQEIEKCIIHGIVERLPQDLGVTVDTMGDETLQVLLLLCVCVLCVVCVCVCIAGVVCVCMRVFVCA